MSAKNNALDHIQPTHDQLAARPIPWCHEKAAGNLSSATCPTRKTAPSCLCRQTLAARRGKTSPTAVSGGKGGCGSCWSAWWPAVDRNSRDLRTCPRRDDKGAWWWAAREETRSTPGISQRGSGGLGRADEGRPPKRPESESDDQKATDDQLQISPAASPEILHHTVWRTFHSLLRWKMMILPILTISLIHLS